MNRFFVEPSEIYDNYIVIKDKEDINHIAKVLRLENDNNIIICDGFGNDYNVEIEKIEKSNIIVRIIGKAKNKCQPNIETFLFQGIPKSSKMELVIQKAVELGITKIFPIITERTIVKFDNKRSIDKKVERWQRVAREACKQCNRGIIPEVNVPIYFKDAVDFAKKLDLVILPYVKEESRSLKKVFNDSREIKNAGIIIGPEGGFTEKESATALINGFEVVTLGPRILRTETAGFTVLSILMYEIGDISL